MIIIQAVFHVLLLLKSNFLKIVQGQGHMDTRMEGRVNCKRWRVQIVRGTKFFSHNSNDMKKNNEHFFFFKHLFYNIYIYTDKESQSQSITITVKLLSRS